MLRRYGSCNKGGRQKHLSGSFFTIVEKLQEAVYRASDKKSDFFSKETTWFGHEINEKRTKPNKGKMKTILQLKPPTSSKELQLLLGGIKYVAKILP